MKKIAYILLIINILSCAQKQTEQAYIGKEINKEDVENIFDAMQADGIRIDQTHEWIFRFIDPSMDKLKTLENQLVELNYVSEQIFQLHDEQLVPVGVFCLEVSISAQFDAQAMFETCQSLTELAKKSGIQSFDGFSLVEDVLMAQAENESNFQTIKYINKGVASIDVVNTKLLSYKNRADYPWLLKIYAIYHTGIETPSEMPDEEEFIRLEQFENSIEDALKNATKSIYAMRSTSQGNRNIWIYVAEKEKVILALDQVKKANILTFNYEFEKDEDWQKAEKNIHALLKL